MENINWFPNTSLFHPQGNKMVTGDFGQSCISSVFIAQLHHFTVTLLNIDYTHQKDQSHQVPLPPYLMSSLRKMKNTQQKKQKCLSCK